MGYEWTQDEINTLLLNYPNNTVKQLQDKFFNHLN